VYGVAFVVVAEQVAFGAVAAGPVAAGPVAVIPVNAGLVAADVAAVTDGSGLTCSTHYGADNPAPLARIAFIQVVQPFASQPYGTGYSPEWNDVPWLTPARIKPMPLGLPVFGCRAFD